MTPRERRRRRGALGVWPQRMARRAGQRAERRQRLGDAGRRCGPRPASSSWRASASSAPSPAGRPTICTASGRPSSPSNSGSEIARLAGGVEDRRERREQARAGERRHRLGRGGVERAERQRALGERGREQRVVGLEEGDQAPGERLQAHGRAHALDRRSASGPSSRSPSSSAPCRFGPSARARRPCPSRRSTARRGWRRPRRTAPTGPPPATADRPPRPRARASAAARRRRRRPARTIGSTHGVGSGRQRRGGDPQPPGVARGAAARTARPAAAPRSRRPARSRRARRGSRRCRRRCA